MAATGERLPQGWQVYVGIDNFTRVFTDAGITGHFFGTFLWDAFFALATVVLAFALGVGLAMLMQGWASRGVRVYRVLLVLPYAMPAFTMLLLWRSMFNTDFGLVNSLLGLHVDWLGQVWPARFAVVLVNVWLGFPYMFLVTTGALQAIPDELTEAAWIDGASRWQGLRRITLPLLSAR